MPMIDYKSFNGVKGYESKTWYSRNYEEEIY